MARAGTKCSWKSIPNHCLTFGVTLVYKVPSWHFSLSTRENKAIFALPALFSRLPLPGCDSTPSPSSWEQDPAWAAPAGTSAQPWRGRKGPRAASWQHQHTQAVALQEEKSTWRVNPCGRIQGTNTSLAHTRKMCCLLRALQKGSIAADPSLKAAPAATVPNRWYIFHDWGSLKCQLYINPPLEGSRGGKKNHQTKTSNNKTSAFEKFKLIHKIK